MSDETRREMVSWIFTILCALVLAIFVNKILIVNATVPTGSMESTIMPKDRIVAFRLSYMFENPKRGDICVFRYPDDETQYYVKRVIGLPGDKVEVRNGKVYINDAKESLNEPYLKEPMNGNFGPYVVPVDSYFMMGDNRNNSLDSRFWNNKFVKKDKILGKVFFRYYPSFTVYGEQVEYERLKPAGSASAQ